MSEVREAKDDRRRGAGGWILPVVSGIGVILAVVAMLVLALRDDTADRVGVDTLRSGRLIVGLQDVQLADSPVADITDRLKRLKVSGALFTRVEVQWAQVAPTKPADPADPADPAYQWGRTDEIIDGLRDRGLEIVVSFCQAPAWSNDNRTPEWFGGLDDYGAFVRAFATRYSGGEHGMVQIYEPWNEPNNAAMLMPQWEGAGASARPVSPTAYAGILQRARAEIAAASPGAAIAGLGLADIETSSGGIGGVGVRDFIAALIPDAPQMDLVSQHLTPIDGPTVATTRVPSIGGMDRYLSLVDRIAPASDVLITAVGYQTPPGGMSEAEQATAIEETFSALARHSRVRLAIWYGVQDTLERPSGLVRVDGSEKPAWKAFLDTPKTITSGTTP